MFLDGITEGVEWAVARFTAVESAALPSSLGELAVQGQREGRVSMPVSTGECSAGAIVRAVRLDLLDPASAWADALFYETLIDGPPL